VNGKLVGLPELEARLRKEALAYARKTSRVADLAVMSIDLLKLGLTDRAGRSGKARPEKKIATKRAKKKLGKK